MNENTGDDDPRARLRALARVTPSDPAYRDTCVEAIELADCLNTVSLEVENLLADFIRSGPSTPGEADAFLVLAKLYLRHGFAANGLEAAEKLARARPGDPRAVALLEKIRERAREGSLPHGTARTAPATCCAEGQDTATRAEPRSRLPPTARASHWLQERSSPGATS